MKEIDVSKCEYKCGIECHIRDYPILNCVDVNIEDCHYKQLQHLKEHCKQIEETNKILYQEKCDLIKENEELKEELSTIQHNCSREGCKYYDDDTFKVFYECTAQKALQLSANSVTTKYCDLLKIITEIKEIAEKEIKPVLEHYANTKVGELQLDGTYKFIYATNDFGVQCITYDPRLAKEGLEIIRRIKNE